MAIKQDADIKLLSPAALRREIMKLRSAIRKHRDADENERCWHNDLRLYGVLPEGESPGRMMGDEKFLLRNCRRYIRRQQCTFYSCKGKGMPLAVLDDTTDCFNDGFILVTRKK